MHIDSKCISLNLAIYFSPSAVFSNHMFEYVLTCLPLYSLKGLYKGTYTLPKQHKRRSGIRFTVVSFLLMTCDTCYVGSICGDTLQQFSISEHVGLCSFITCPPSSVRAACDEENVCPDIDLCVCSFWMCFLSPSLPLNEESFCTLIKTQITLHFMNTISTYKKSNLNLVCRLTGPFY